MSAKAILSASVSAAPVYVEDVFSTFLYTGNGTTQTITNGIDLAGKGGLVWTKDRTATANHFLIDSARNNDSFLISNTTGGEASSGPTYNVVFNSNGFTDGLSNRFFSGDNIASWTFRKAPKFFDVVTYTGTGANRTIAHNLGSVPGSIIVKRTDTTAAWAVYHRSLANTQYLVLNTTAAAATGATWWNSTTPTSSVFSVGTDASVNASGGTYVAYVFAHDAGGFGTAGTDNVVSCGTTTVSSNTASVTLGYEPQLVMMKCTSGISNWFLVDNMRGFSSSASPFLRLDGSAAESANAGTQCNATGFTSSGVFENGTYIYIAIRRGPMKTPTVGTEVFSASTSTQSSSALVSSGFPVDMYLTATRTASPEGYGIEAKDRLRGICFLATSKTDAEADSGLFSFDYSTGVVPARFSNSPITLMFRRAPGFFDVVAYTGTSANRTVSHNLGVAPELMIVKKRSATDSWAVYSSAVGSTKVLFLDTNLAAITYSNNWNNTNPTNSVFTVGTSSDVNESGFTYIAYLFATAPGVSKVGTYTGTGTTKQLDCGFTAGARFVLIKRTDDTGDWYVWDTARGIISGNDPYLQINSAAAEDTSTDYIDPLSSGFEISSTAPAAINANGGTYIFLSIA